MKGVQCYELFGGIALKIHTFSFSFFIVENIKVYLQIFYWLLRVSKCLPPMHFRQLNFLFWLFIFNLSFEFDIC